MLGKKEENKNIITMVDRSAHIMEFIYKSEEAIGVSKIAADLDMPKATVFRILTTLQKWGFVEKYKDTDEYILGKVLIKYGGKAKSHINLIEIASMDLTDLAQNIGETVNLGIQHGNSVLTVFSEEGESSVLVSKLIPISPLYCSSMGKVFLSKLTDEELKEYFDSESIYKRTNNSITRYEDFLLAREEILKNNISFDNEEYEYGLTCIASPIKNQDSEIIAAVSVSSPTSRLQFKGIDYVKDSLIETVEKIEAKVVYL